MAQVGRTSQGGRSASAQDARREKRRIRVRKNEDIYQKSGHGIVHRLYGLGLFNYYFLSFSIWKIGDERKCTISLRSYKKSSKAGSSGDRLVLLEAWGFIRERSSLCLSIKRCATLLRS